LEPDIRYYSRRACEEMSAAARAITPEARQRRLQLVNRYLDHLKELNAPPPFDELRFAGMMESAPNKSLAGSLFAWREAGLQTEHA
jgi:hypothetical protein